MLLVGGVELVGVLTTRRRDGQTGADRRVLGAGGGIRVAMRQRGADAGRGGSSAGPPADKRVAVAADGPGDGRGAYQDVDLAGAGKTVQGRLYECPGAAAGVVMVGGVEGGYDSPARDLYPRLASELVGEGVSVLRVRFRFPTVLEKAHHDVVAGVDHLTAAGVGRVALVGHSFGGAAVIAAAVDRVAVVAVCALSTQSYGTEAAARHGGRALLLVHGTEDRVLPPACSKAVFVRARNPRRLELLEGAGHTLVEVTEDVHALVGGWLREQLGVGARTGCSA